MGILTKWRRIEKMGFQNLQILALYSRERKSLYNVVVVLLFTSVNAVDGTRQWEVVSSRQSLQVLY